MGSPGTYERILLREENQAYIHGQLVDLKDITENPCQKATHTIEQLHTIFQTTIGPLIDRILKNKPSRTMRMKPLQYNETWLGGERHGEILPEDIEAVYSPSEGRALVRLTTKHPKEAILAHEYTHHHQLFGGSFDFIHTPTLCEGHAVGVHLAIITHLQSQNTLFEKIRRYELSRYFSGAAKILAQHTRAFDKALPNVTEHLKGLQPHVQRPYTIGYTLFAIAEAKHGPGIYAEVLRNPRVVLE